MKKKIIITFAKFILIVNSLVFISCDKKTAWYAAVSQPKNYVAEGQHVFYLRDGKIIGSSTTISNVGNAGWDYAQNESRGKDFGLLPDSVVVDYGGLNNKNQMCTYRGGMSLPTKEMEKLFKKGYEKDGEHIDFRNITTGLAPGGRICVWIDHVEIKRGIVSQEDVYLNHPTIITDIKSKQRDSIEINNYLKHHPVDYSLWEKPDLRYELDFGFCTENENFELHHSFFITKEGISYAIYKQYFEETEFGKPYGQPSSNDLFFGYIQKNEAINYKFQLPIHCKIEWKSKTIKNLYYSTDVVFPKNFSKRFTQPYKHPETGKKTNYNRLVFGVEKDGEHCIIWLDGPGKQEKLMRFKAQKGKIINIGIDSGGYATDVIYY